MKSIRLNCLIALVVMISAGRVLKGDPTIVFTRDARRLTMTDATPTGSATRI